MEIDWKIVAPIVGAFVAILTLFFKRHEVTSLKHKKISDRLASSIQYFEKYYEKGQTNQLVLDRAAQDLAKSPNVDHNLVNQLIEFHQNYLVDFDQMILLFDEGSRYISYQKGQTLNISKDLSIKPFIFLKLNWRRYIFITGYFIFAFLGLLLFVVLVNIKEVQIIVLLVLIIWSVVFIAFALLFLMLEDSLKQAENFIKQLDIANKKYTTIEKPKTIILLDRNGKPS
ncbi:hypothetical protein [Acinetobacter sp. ANC 3832]|uniref:hypothetical protein n=1 Tax=Acinetobacter sp. ANC 3832 TaxID=1977874 RepID=UPI000A34B9DF|nr:hypothetical protein [Acinetobacter sp. ANC 3832]OTG94238.1 hypothetical protein B9T35_07475 [Acinetobacter sp. ANC 3832]